MSKRPDCYELRRRQLVKFRCRQMGKTGQQLRDRTFFSTLNPILLPHAGAEVSSITSIKQVKNGI